MLKIIFLLFLTLTLSACGANPDERFDNLPVGDATRGEALYTQTINGAPACSTCHAFDDTIMAGPSLANYGIIAETRVEGQSALRYTYEAIVLPSRHLVEGYSNLMYTGYASALNDQQLADLMAYLLDL